MAETATKVDVKTAEKGGVSAKAPTQEPYRQPLMTLRGEIDRLFDDFSRGWGMFPFGRRAFEWEPLWRGGAMFGAAAPAVDIAEKEGGYQITAELPGLDEKAIEVTVSDDTVRIKGEKREEKEEKKKDYHLSERRFGSFERSFRLPEGVDKDKIEASFSKGVLTIMLPKSAEARQKETKIAVKAA